VAGYKEALRSLMRDLIFVLRKILMPVSQYFLIQNRKLILSVGALVLIAIILFVVVQVWKLLNAPPDISNDFSRPLPEKNPNGYFVIEGIGKTGEVLTKDFLVKKEPINPQGDRILSEKPEYSISYINPFRQFFIAFNSIPSVDVRVNAEKELLEMLGVSAQDACALDIHETVSAIEGDEYAGVNFGFSSCPNGRVIPQ